MTCPCAHEWYELERGTAPREEAERLRRHLAECPECWIRAGEVRSVAAAMERLAGGTRVDLPDAAAESVFRRARVHGLLGRPMKMPLSVRVARVRWGRVGVAMAVAAAAALLLAVIIPHYVPGDAPPRGALERLVQAARGVRNMDGLQPLAPVARAAVTEELARADAMSDQVADLLLVAYIARRPRENRQVADVNFLLGAVEARRHSPGAARTTTVLVPAWPLRTLLPQARADTASAPPDGRTLTGDFGKPAKSIEAALERLLDGRYADALAAMPVEPATAPARAWCLEALGRTSEAAQVLAPPAAGAAEGPMTRILKADLALAGQDVAEALRQYEALAAAEDRYWFSAGYLCRYELRDARSAGLRFQRVREPRLAAYVGRTFAMELASVKAPTPAPMFSEDFDSYAAGAPADWVLIRTRGGEFNVVDVPRGKALQQSEVRSRGAEFLCGTADWADYTVQADVKVLESKGDYAIAVAGYRGADQAGYVVELTPGTLRIVKQFASRTAPGQKAAERLLLEPMQAQMRLEEPPARGWWYTVKLRVQRVDGGTSVAGKMWRTDTEEPLGWQVVWTDLGQAGAQPLPGGLAGLQISGAKVLIDNLAVTLNESPVGVAVAPK